MTEPVPPAPSAGGPVRTRFAPSPTGRLHLGNVRVAVFNWLFTRHHGGSFVLRIEDTDVERNVEGAEAALMEDLRWLGLQWDEGPDVGGPFGPYRQSARAALYDDALERLLASGAAYRCFCSEEEQVGADRRYAGTCRGLDPEESARRAGEGEPHVIRIRTPGSGEVSIRDEVRGVISFPANDIDDFILRRRDGRPTYNFAVVVDDVTMEITHVIRGAGHLSNTPRQALIFDALDRARPRFVHLPNVLSPTGGKLSKREGATGIADFRARGFLPEALVNYLSLLGWSHPEEREILTVEELVASVDLDRVGVSETAYDPEKLEWVGSQHMARLSLEEVVEGVKPFLDRERFPLDDEALPAAIQAIRTRLNAFGDVNEHLVFAFPEEGPGWEALRESVRRDPEAVAVVEAARRELAGVEDWSRDEIRSAVKRAGKATGARGPALFHPLRMALTGAEAGPDLGGLCEAVGKETVLARLDRVPG